MGQWFNLVPQQVWPGFCPSHNAIILEATPFLWNYSTLSNTHLSICSYELIITTSKGFSHQPNSPIHTCTQPFCPNLSVTTLQVRNQGKIKVRKAVDSWSPVQDVGLLSICSTQDWGEYSACGRHTVLYLRFSTPRTPAATDQSLLYPVTWRHWSDLLNSPSYIYFWAHPRSHFSFYTGLTRPASSSSSVGLFLTWRRVGALGGSSYWILNALCTIFWKYAVTYHFCTQQY